MGEHVVLVAFNEGRDGTEHLQDVEEVLVDSLTGQINVLEFESEEVVAHGADLLIGLHVVHVDNVDVVKGFVEALGNFGLEVDDTIEDAQLFQVHQLQQVLRVLLERILPLYLLDQHEVDVYPQEILDLPLQGQHVAALELV